MMMAPSRSYGNAQPVLLELQVKRPDISQRVPILVYHRVHPDDAPPVIAGQYCGHVVLSTFIRQMNYLRDHGFSVVTHQDLYHWLQGEADLPPKPVLIDFDDNRGTVYDNAFPLLQQYGWRATCFVITALADSCLPKYQDDYLSDGSGWYTWMTWQELGELRDAGWTIGAHTRTHPNLRKLEEAGRHRRVVAELRRSKKDIQRKLGLTPFCFAYPGGAWNEAVEEVAGQFYQTVRHWHNKPPFRYVTRETNPLRLPAHNVSEQLLFVKFVAFVEQPAVGDDHRPTVGGGSWRAAGPTGVNPGAGVELSADRAASFTVTQNLASCQAA